MPTFPSLDWCRALVEAARRDPDIGAAAREWAGRSVGVVIGRDKGLARDFCVYAEVHADRAELKLLRECPDEDDLAVDEPAYLFRVPYGLALKMMSRKVDPLDALRAGDVRVEGDLKFLVTFGQKWRALGERCIDAVGAPAP
jgi:hypothetical protein